jgi:hypothetical protein
MYLTLEMNTVYLDYLRCFYNLNKVHECSQKNKTISKSQQFKYHLSAFVGNLVLYNFGGSSLCKKEHHIPKSNNITLKFPCGVDIFVYRDLFSVYIKCIKNIIEPAVKTSFV